MKNISYEKVLAVFFSLFLLGAGQISEETCEQGIRNVSKVIHINFFQFQIEQMMLAYQSKDPMTGIAIIEHGIEWFSGLENQKNMILDENSLPKEKAIWYVRIGNLYSRLGEQNRYESYLEKALTLYNSTCDGSRCKKVSQEKLIWLVNKMDNS